jgi:hypothetical protein
MQNFYSLVYLLEEECMKAHSPFSSMVSHLSFSFLLVIIKGLS